MRIWIWINCNKIKYLRTHKLEDTKLQYQWDKEQDTFIKHMLPTTKLSTPVPKQNKIQTSQDVKSQI
jgi:hypothetical protein